MYFQWKSSIGTCNQYSSLYTFSAHPLNAMAVLIPSDVFTGLVVVIT